MAVDPFQEILDNNGNSHHSKVVMSFRNLGWQTLVSPYYSDNITDKSREIDVIVEKDTEVNGRHTGSIGFIRTRLFLECKYINQETVLWFDNKDMNRTREIIDRRHGIDSSRDKQLAKDYHYGNDVPVAKLFGNKKSDENDLLSRAINQCLNAFIYYRYKTTSLEPSASRSKTILDTISYPVIVCNSFSKFKWVTMSDSKQTLKNITDPFQLEVNYAYLDNEKRPQNEFFLIDVITIDQIEEYITILENSDISEKSEAESNKAFYSGNTYDDMSTDTFSSM